MFVLPSREQLKQINVWRRIYSGSDGKIRRGREEDEAQAAVKSGEVSSVTTEYCVVEERCVTMILKCDTQL